MKTVYIEDVADALEATMEEWNQFLNTETGEVVSLPDGDLYGNWNMTSWRISRIKCKINARLLFFSVR